MEAGTPKTPLVFYRTAAGAEPVRDWLVSMDKEERLEIGRDLQRAQFRWPVGMPLCRPMGQGLFEVRTTLPTRKIARVLICHSGGVLYALHGFIKKTGRRQRPICRSLCNARRTLNLAENKHAGSSIDDLLREEGVQEEFQARAIKEVLAWQLAEAMKEKKLSRRKLAELMHTSRTQIDRVLDPLDGNVTLATLQRAAAVVGRKVTLELV